MSASPERLILMLFDGALDAMNRAKVGFEMEGVRERNETISNNLIKAQQIFEELQRSLRMDKNTAFAEKMFDLYEFYTTQLSEANFKKTQEPIDIVIRLFTEIREVWAEMLTKQSVKAEPAPAFLSSGVGGGLSLRA